MTGAGALLARTFLIGIAVAAPVGAMGVLCIQRTLVHGWRSGIATGAGIATADAIYAGFAAFGVAAVSSRLVAWQTPLRLVGGAFLIFLGVSTLLRRPAQRTGEIAADPVRPGHGALYFSAVGLTLTNPMTIMAFAAVFASAGLVAAPGVTAAAVSTAGVALGSLSWWMVLVGGVTLARHGLSERAVSWITKGSGAVVAVFGLLAVVSAL
ncbi:MAG: lysine transporter LysE [Actinobacteria bacterium HGW-Actinobacteria-7]|nr:MAG: lysine transporter LysE [Actinobacteria bacterium HGW-Actinobacteria-7]